MNVTVQSRLEDVDTLKAALDAARPLPPHTLASLRAKLALDWTYHSNAIEGNSLTLRETRVVLEGITIGGKSLREHMEAVNHRDAIFYVEQIVAGGEALSEWQIKNIHRLVLKGIDDAEAGRYRQSDVVIAGASTTPASFLHVPEQMPALVALHLRASDVHPVRRAAQLHARLVKIHPFIDGNGRTARLLMNVDLMKAGFPPAVISSEQRVAYYDALDQACAGDNDDAITELLADAVKRSLTTYLDLLALSGPASAPDRG